MDLIQAIQYNDEKPATLQLSNSTHQQVIAIGLKKGQVLKKHVTTQPALLVVLKGSIEFKTEATTSKVAALHTHTIVAHEPHEVLGLEESIFLLIREKA